MKNHLADYNKIQLINGGKGTDTVTLKVRHGQENEISINANSWCDIGGHKVPEYLMVHGMFDPQICEDCFDHFN